MVYHVLWRFNRRASPFAKASAGQVRTRAAVAIINMRFEFTEIDIICH